MFDDEIWKDIYFWQDGVEFDYRGMYQVSNYGRVKSLKYGKEQLLKNVIDKGYMLVSLSKNNKRRNFRIHRLVAHIFVEGYFVGAQVDHIDTNKTNNHFSNLRWCTPKENTNNPLTMEHRKETLKIGENHPMYGKSPSEETRKKRSESMKGKNKGKYLGTGRLIDMFNIEDTFISSYYIYQLVEMGFCASQIYNCCNGKKNSHKKHKFRYHQEED